MLQFRTTQGVIDEQVVLISKQTWIGQWATDVIRTCSNYSQKCGKQSYFLALLFRFLGLSRKGIEVLHMTLGGVSLRSIDTLSECERDKYIHELHQTTNTQSVTWYADNYTHRFNRSKLQVDNPNYVMMNTTVCAMGVNTLERKMLLLKPSDNVVDPNILNDTTCVDRLARSCATAVEAFDGDNTLAARYNVNNWPPKPKMEILPLALQRK